MLFRYYEDTKSAMREEALVYEEDWVAHSISNINQIEIATSTSCMQYAINRVGTLWHLFMSQCESISIQNESHN